MYRIYGRVVAIPVFGTYRIANEATRGYAVWVGVGGMPDLSADPTHFSNTLPVSIPVVPPGVGTDTYYVVTRERDAYGLLSQNQRATVITIDTSGQQVDEAIPVPQEVLVGARGNGAIRFRGTYPTMAYDYLPATHWRMWIDSVPVDPETDPPTATLPTRLGYPLFADLTPFTPGTYYWAVALYRSSDGVQSPAVEGTVEYPEDPVEPGDTHGPESVSN